MENNLNENFTLSKEQIIFIDDGFISKQKNIKDVIEELVKQDDNNFKKKDIKQIIELYMEIKRQKAKQEKPKRRNEWTQEQKEKLQKALEAEIKKKGKSIEIIDLAEELEETGSFEPHDKLSITRKLYELADKLEEYRRIKPKLNRNEWPQEQEEELKKALKEEIKKKGKSIEIIDLAEELEKTRSFEPHDKLSIARKLYELADESEEYRRIKPQLNRNKWTQEQKEKLQKALEAEIKKKGKDINIKALARKLKKIKELKNCSENSIVKKLHELLKEYRQIKPKQSRNNWSQEELEKLQKALEAEIKKKGKSINITALAEELKETGLFGPHNKRSIANKLYKLMKQSECNQEEDKITENVGTENYNYININSQNNDGIDKDLAKRLEEKLNKYFNDAEQFNNTEDRLTKINILENDKSDNPDTSTLEATKENQLLSNLSNAANSMNQISSISTEKNDFNSVMLETNNKKENLKRSLDDLHNVESDISETTENISPLIFLSDKSDSSFNELRHPYSSLPNIL